mmetsp:Transcript_113166/g.365629  ORF Transcript_113166/g.365629 Transcript_113166/m.365629 type:complete len:790 (+) Transcript_113166:125-2494(+)
MASRADNGMDPYRVLGTSECHIQGKEDLLKLKRKCKAFIEDFQRKRQGANAKRVKWAFDQVVLKFKKSTSSQATAESQLAADSQPAVARAVPDHASRCEIIRSKAAARRQRLAAGEESLDAAKRHEAIRERLALKRSYKQVPAMAEEDCRRRVIESVSSAKSTGIELHRFSLVCPISADRMKTPARGRNCQHLQCFDLEAFLFGKRSQCPVCGLDLEVPEGLCRDAYIARILAATAGQVREVGFDQSGEWKVVRAPAQPSAPSEEPKEEAEGRQVDELEAPCAKSGEGSTPSIPCKPADPDDTIHSQRKLSEGSPEPPVRVDGLELHPAECAGACPPTVGQSSSGCSTFGQTAAGAAQKASFEEKRERAKRYHALRPEELVDPTDENNYFVVELPKAMGILFQPNATAIGGAFIESFDAGSAAANHGGLRVNDQLVGIGDKLVKGQDLDACIDLILASDGLTTRLTVFRGTASRLYGRGGASDEWLRQFMAKVAEGGVDVTPPAPASNPGPDPAALRAEKRRRQSRLTVPVSGGSASSEDLSLSTESSAESGASLLPDDLSSCVQGSGLEGDLQRCIEALPQLPADGGQKRGSGPRALARSALRACIAGNGNEWAEVEDQPAWRSAARKRLARAAGERAERLEALKRQKEASQQLASLAARRRSRQEPQAEAKPDAPLLSVEPARVIHFHRSLAAHLTLRNPTTGCVAFRVRTSAPRFISVKPCTGTLAQGSQLRLHVCCSERRVVTSDLKFLVQAAAAETSGEMPREKWSELSAHAIQEWTLGGQIRA